MRLKAPEPATVVLEFTPADGIEGELLVKKGTQVATLQAAGTDPVTFETLRDLALIPVHVVRAVSSHRGTVADHTPALAAGDADDEARVRARRAGRAPHHARPPRRRQ